jgi:hypothetical protein
MTAGDLLAIIRADYLDDDVTPYAWSDAFLLREIGRAQQQACWRQDLRHLYDNESFAVTVTEGVRSYALDPLILRIDEILFDGEPLIFTTRAMLDLSRPGWRNTVDGIPVSFYVQGRKLYLDRAPSAAEDGLALSIHAWREPLIDPMDLGEHDDLEWTNDPEQLAHWVAYRAFLRRDEDTQNKEHAKLHLDLFNATFGAEVPVQARAELLMYPADLTIAPARNRPLLGEHEDW